jgi:LPXTG-motif cell wall-anchored protein
MAPSRLVALLVALALLALPALALADSAGDNQYSDPFGNSQPAQTAPTTTQPPLAPPSNATTSQPSSSAAPTASSSDPNSELPRTGLDVRVVGAIGVLLLGSGLLLRRRRARG